MDACWGWRTHWPCSLEPAELAAARIFGHRVGHDGTRSGWKILKRTSRSTNPALLAISTASSSCIPINRSCLAGSRPMSLSQSDPYTRSLESFHFPDYISDKR
jgi:hypothetical protein